MRKYFELNEYPKLWGFSENVVPAEKLALIVKNKRVTEVSIWKVLCPLVGWEGHWPGEVGGSLPASGWWNPSPCCFWAICFLECSCPGGMEELVTGSGGMGTTGWWSSVLPESRGARWPFCVRFPFHRPRPGRNSSLLSWTRNSPSAPKMFYQKVAVLGQNHTVSS